MTDELKITFRPGCTCQLVDVSAHPSKPEFVRGDSKGCERHGKERAAAIAAAEWRARYGDEEENPSA